MSDIESRLRAAFRADAESVKAVRHFVPPSRGLTRWAGTWRAGSIAIPVAAATAVAAIAVGSTVMPALRSGHPAGPTAAAAPPKFIVVISAIGGRSHPNATGLEVVATATGKVVGRLAPPGHGQLFQAVAVTGSDRQFAVEASSTAACETFFYTFSLSALGKPGHLRPYPVAHVPGLPTRLEHPTLAASADGKTLGFATSACPTGGRAGGQLGVVHSDGQVRAWHYVYPAAPQTLSLTANGSLLELSSTASRPLARGAATVREAIWVIRTSAPAGPLSQHYRQVRPAPKDEGQQPSVISPAGRITYGEIQRLFTHNPRVHTTITAYRTSNGKPIRLVSSRLTGDLTLSGSGRYLLTFPGSASPSRPVHDLVGLDLAKGKMITVPRNPGGRVISAAW